MPRFTFSRFVPGTYDPSTDTETPGAVTTIAGEGIIMSGDPEQFAAQELVLETTPVIGFTPDNYPLKAFTDEFVRPGDATVLNGKTATVAKILKVVALDGYVVYSRIAVRV